MILLTAASPLARSPIPEAVSLLTPRGTAECPENYSPVGLPDPGLLFASAKWVCCPVSANVKATQSAKGIFCCGNNDNTCTAPAVSATSCPNGPSIKLEPFDLIACPGSKKRSDEHETPDMDWWCETHADPRYCQPDGTPKFHNRTGDTIQRRTECDIAPENGNCNNLGCRTLPCPSLIGLLLGVAFIVAFITSSTGAAAIPAVANVERNDNDVQPYHYEPPASVAGGRLVPSTLGVWTAVLLILALLVPSITAAGSETTCPAGYAARTGTQTGTTDQYTVCCPAEYSQSVVIDPSIPWNICHDGSGKDVGMVAASVIECAQGLDRINFLGRGVLVCEVGAGPVTVVSGSGASRFTDSSPGFSLASAIFQLVPHLTSPISARVELKRDVFIETCPAGSVAVLTNATPSNGKTYIYTVCCEKPHSDDAVIDFLQKSVKCCTGDVCLYKPEDVQKCLGGLGNAFTIGSGKGVTVCRGDEVLHQSTREIDMTSHSKSQKRGDGAAVCPYGSFAVPSKAAPGDGKTYFYSVCCETGHSDAVVINFSQNSVRCCTGKVCTDVPKNAIDCGASSQYAGHPTTIGVIVNGVAFCLGDEVSHQSTREFGKLRSKRRVEHIDKSLAILEPSEAESAKKTRSLGEQADQKDQAEPYPKTRGHGATSASAICPTGFHGTAGAFTGMDGPHETYIACCPDGHSDKAIIASTDAAWTDVQIFCCGKQDCDAMAMPATCADGAVSVEDLGVTICQIASAKEKMKRSAPLESQLQQRSAASRSLRVPSPLVLVLTVILAISFIVQPVLADIGDPATVITCPPSYSWVYSTETGLDGKLYTTGVNHNEYWLTCCPEPLDRQFDLALIDRIHQKVMCCAPGGNRRATPHEAVNVEDCYYIEPELLEPRRNVFGRYGPQLCKVTPDKSPKVLEKRKGGDHSTSAASHSQNIPSPLLLLAPALLVLASSLTANRVTASTDLDMDTAEPKEPANDTTMAPHIPEPNFCPQNSHHAYADYRYANIVMIACCPDEHTWTDTAIIDKLKRKRVECCKGQYCAGPPVSALCDDENVIGLETESLGLFGDRVEVCYIEIYK